MRKARMPRFKRRPDYLVMLAALGLGLVIALVTLTALGYASANRAVEHTREVREQVGQWLTAMIDIQAASRGMLLGGTDSSAADYQRALAHERRQSAIVVGLLGGQAVHRDNLRAATTHAREALSAYATKVSL